MAQKKYTFPNCCEVKDKNGKTSLKILTQVYQTGIYVAVYSPKSSIPNQLSLTPGQTVKFMKQFRPDNLLEGCISQFGPEITVQKVDGFWKKVE